MIGQVTTTSTQDTINGMREDLDMMAAVSVPDVYISPMSDMHHSIWMLITEVIQAGETYTKHAIGIPRGHAKTHMLKLLILYCILFTDLRFILVVGNTLKLARNIIDDVMSMLGSANIQALFGDYRIGIEKDNAEIREFNFMGRDIILMPIGSGSSVRGANVNNRRPQLIICDDMQSREQAKSKEQSDELLSWFLGTLLKARDYNRCHVIYVGNMYPDLEITPKGHPNPVYTCILRNLQKDEDWITWVTGAFLADGSTIWPQVHPKEALLKDLASDTRMGKQHIWYAEVQNDPRASEGMFFDPTRVMAYETTIEFQALGRFIMIDPSLGKKTSDNQVVGEFAIYDEQGVVWEECRTIQKPAPQLVMEVLTWALERGIGTIFCETYGYQASLLQWFAFFLNQMQIPEEAIQLIGITRPGGNTGPGKNAWLIQSFGYCYSGTLRFRPQALAAYKYEAEAFNPLATDNSDGILDVGEYAVRVFQEYGGVVIGNNRVLTAAHVSSTRYEEVDCRLIDYREL
jgi:hypothetical protein